MASDFKNKFLKMCRLQIRASHSETGCGIQDYDGCHTTKPTFWCLCATKPQRKVQQSKELYHFPLCSSISVSAGEDISKDLYERQAEEDAIRKPRIRKEFAEYKVGMTSAPCGSILSPA